MKFPKLSRGQAERFARASAAYKEGEYSECYALIDGLADEGAARAYYCKALLSLNGNVPEAAGAEAFEENAKRAAALKYPLACGLLAKFYFENDGTDELASLCLQNKKSEDGRLVTLLAALYDGFYADGTYENAKAAAKAYALAERSFAKALKEAGNLPEWSENDLYGAETFALKHSYAFYNRLLMISYRYAEAYANREAYRTAYRRATEYAGSPAFLFSVHRLNADTLMRDIMGLSELKAVNGSMQALERAYGAMSDGERAGVEEAYADIRAQYEEYYRAESARLRSLNVRADDGFDSEFQGRGALDMVADLAQGVRRWANTPARKTTVTYTIDGRKYTADEYGALCDEQGIRSDYRVDDVGRLYENGTRLGYFSTDGIFMKE